MTAEVNVIAGPPRSGKTQRLLVRYRELLAENTPGVALWLAPTWRAKAQLCDRLMDGPCDACFSPGVMTFEGFAETVLQSADEPIRPMPRLMKRQLVRRLIDEHLAAGRLKHFLAIARTGGLVELICEFISELKRLEIWPEHFFEACRARGITDKDTELLEIYDEYQRRLREHQLYDPEGRFWSARDLLSKTDPAQQSSAKQPLANLRLVVAAGFTDFTRTQHEILQILAGRIDELAVSLPLEPVPPAAGTLVPRRRDLFAKSTATLAELQRRHPRLNVHWQPAAARSDWPAMAHLEKHVFGDPRQQRPTSDTARIEILAAARQRGEAEWIGARIKRLLTRGDPDRGGQAVRPGEIAIVFRSAQDADSPIAEVLTELGVPFALETGQTLDRSPALAALVTLLRLDTEDWAPADLLAVLRNNYFRPDWPEWHHGRTVATAERIIRRLQIARGREHLFNALEATGSLQQGLSDTVVVLRRLAAALEDLPQKASPGQWAKAWQRLARETGLAAVAEEDLPERLQVGLSDRQAWARMTDAMDSGDTLADWLESQPPMLDRREALAALQDVLTTERVGFGGDESGRVRVLSAVAVRALRVPYLFLAGLSERAFPPPERQDPLYSEAESQQLIEQGLPLVARTERNRAEMLLFYEVMTRATQRLWLSYPALDESAQPLLPSPFLEEVEQAFGTEGISRIEWTDLSPVPAGDDPLSETEFRIMATSSAMAGNVAMLAGLIGHDRQRAVAGEDGTPCAAENLLAGLQLTHLRRGREHFSAAEGMLPGKDVQRDLAQRFSVERTYSATKLEQYAACPYRFYLDSVLKLKPVEELALSVDHAQRGLLAHDVLAALHRRINRSLGRAASPLEADADDYARLLGEAIEEVLPPASVSGFRAALREIDRRWTLRWIGDYLDQHRRYDKLSQQCDTPLVPEFFEVSFGREGEELDPPSTDRPLELPAAGHSIRLAGRIDRIDTGSMAGRCVFNVIDYKTGSPKTFKLESVVRGTMLQLPVYALAVARLLLDDRSAVPWQIGYWHVRRRGFTAKPLHARHGDELVPESLWNEMCEALPGTIARLLDGIRQGEFAVYNEDEHCTGYCPFATVCRIHQIRALGKTWAGNTRQGET
ncbi:MAG: PD-(D/E)XK nuclease family protein [Candidatus Nealsonbacteria bacterium]|nr:PD-(D/E)XK nuclease family protein [Candidatus Nealsonbacteria bacterium]